MMQLSLAQVPEADIVYDPAQHRWTVTLLDETRHLSEWRWAARKRLLAAAADSGRIDASRFAQGFGALCWTPEPSETDAQLWAWIGLSLAGLGPLVPPAEAEGALAARLGLTPTALEGEYASDLEPLLVAEVPPMTAEPGWTMLRFGDDAA